MRRCDNAPPGVWAIADRSVAPIAAVMKVERIIFNFVFL